MSKLLGGLESVMLVSKDKVVMINNVCFASDAWVVEEKKAWFVGTHNCILYEIDRTNYLCTQLGLIPGDVEGEFRQHVCAGKVGEDIYIVPDRGNDIIVYNVKEQQYTNIGLFKEKCRLSVIYVCELSRCIVFFSLGLQEIICIDIDTQTIVKTKSLSADTREVYYYNNKFYCISEESKITIFNETFEVECDISFNNIKSNISKLLFDGDMFWIIGSKNDIYVWKGTEKQLLELSIPGISESNMNSGQAHFQFVQLVNNSIWLFPFYGSEVIVIKCDTKEIKAIDYLEQLKKMECVGMEHVHHDYFVEYIYDNRYIGVYAVKQRIMLEIDSETFESRILPIELDDSCKNINYICQEPDPVDRKVFWKSILQTNI